MYLTITPQKLTQSFSQSAGHLVSYLEKENEGKSPDQKEFFFSQYSDEVEPSIVTREIDGNSAKLKKTEPRYYSMTINPSKRELQHIDNDPQLLKKYTREIMKEYAVAFNREINGRLISVDDIKYFAKVEFQRTFKGTDREIKENSPFIKKIASLENQIRKVIWGEEAGNLNALKKELQYFQEKAPHKSNGKVIEQGMAKEGLQTHIHLIVSRKDASNSYSLSPGSKYRSSEVVMHGKIVKRGFDRDHFYGSAEKVFDKMFGYNRNYVESYEGRKALTKNPQKYYSHLKDLSVQERRIAFMLLNKTGIHVPYLNISPNQVSFALKQIKKALETGIRSSSIGY